jgi:hypothetical protein
MAVRIKDKAAVTEVDSSDRFGIDGTVGLRSWSWVNLVAGLKSGTKLAAGLTTTFFQDVSEKSLADGYASLDSGGTVPLSELPTSVKGTSTINSQTGTSYTLVLADAGAIIEMNNASANSLLLPAIASVALPVGTTLDVVQMGAGLTTVAIVPASGVVIRGNVISFGQYRGLSLYKRSDDEWVVFGGTV